MTPGPRVLVVALTTTLLVCAKSEPVGPSAALEIYAPGLALGRSVGENRAVLPFAFKRYAGFVTRLANPVDGFGDLLMQTEDVGPEREPRQGATVRAFRFSSDASHAAERARERLRKFVGQVPERICGRTIGGGRGQVLHWRVVDGGIAIGWEEQGATNGVAARVQMTFYVGDWRLADWFVLRDAGPCPDDEDISRSLIEGPRGDQ